MKRKRKGKRIPIVVCHPMNGWKEVMAQPPKKRNKS